MRKILITGGAGFIGSALVRYIINETSDAVVVVDKLTYAGNLMSLAPVAQSERFAFEKADICDRAELARVFTEYQPDCVMHASGSRKPCWTVLLTARQRLLKPTLSGLIHCLKRRGLTGLR